MDMSKIAKQQTFVSRNLNIVAVYPLCASQKWMQGYRKNSKNWNVCQSDQDLHCLPFFLHLLEALLQCKIKLFYIKDNYGRSSGCPNI